MQLPMWHTFARWAFAPPVGRDFLMGIMLLMFLVPTAVAILNRDKKGADDAAKSPEAYSNIHPVAQPTGDPAFYRNGEGVTRERPDVAMNDIPAELQAIFSAASQQEFRTALLRTRSDSTARRMYQQVSGEGVRIRNGSSETSPVLRVMTRGAYVLLDDYSTENGWCKVRLSDGTQGWMKCSFLAPIAPSRPIRWE